MNLCAWIGRGTPSPLSLSLSVALAAAHTRALQRRPARQAASLVVTAGRDCVAPLLLHPPSVLLLLCGAAASPITEGDRKHGVRAPRPF